MKRTFLALSLSALAASAFAGPVKLGADVAGALTIPSVSSPGTSPDTKVGFGVKAAFAGQYDLNEKFGIRGDIGYQLNTWTITKKSVDEDEEGNPTTTSTDVDATSHFITINADAVYKVLPQVQAIGGLGVDIPVSGSYSVGSTSEDIEHDQTSLFLEVGAGYSVTPALAVTAKYRLPLTNYIDNNGYEAKLHQVQVGVSYDFN